MRGHPGAGRLVAVAQQRTRDFRGPHGDAGRHLEIERLVPEFDALDPAPTDVGRLDLIVARREDHARETPARVELTPTGGVPGDAWYRDLPDLPDKQVTASEAELMRGIAESFGCPMPPLLAGQSLA